MKSIAAFVICVSVVVSVAAETKRQWQEGTWRDTERVAVLAGAVSNGGGTAVTNGTTTTGTTTRSTVNVYRVSQTFVIETPDRWFVASQRLKWRWSKPVPMTVNGPVRFAVEKDKLYVIGEDEKEYELVIEKKGLKVVN